eukprot:TRINITY_DN38449_c0_g1_i3.p1 TRINITY_DN38449_c0_g1~~TRINITY_DN38449_c0_g1_i3.p1  ORF type:complete len:326 (+),score=69.34 TRINITY_DN38449_c0_g1_i3:88-1065(+)
MSSPPAAWPMPPETSRHSSRRKQSTTSVQGESAAAAAVPAQLEQPLMASASETDTTSVLQAVEALQRWLSWSAERFAARLDRLEQSIEKSVRKADLVQRGRRRRCSNSILTTEAHGRARCKVRSSVHSSKKCSPRAGDKDSLSTSCDAALAEVDTAAAVASKVAAEPPDSTVASDCKLQAPVEKASSRKQKKLPGRPSVPPLRVSFLDEDACKESDPADNWEEGDASRSSGEALSAEAPPAQVVVEERRCGVTELAARLILFCGGLSSFESKAVQSVYNRMYLFLIVAGMLGCCFVDSASAGGGPPLTSTARGGYSSADTLSSLL